MEPLIRLDVHLFYLINHYLVNGFFDWFCPVMRNPRVLYFIYILIVVRVYQIFPQHFWKLMIAGAITFTITDQLAAHVIKPLVQRVRPCNDPLVDARLVIQQCGSGFSFISAHATNSFGMATFLTLIRRKRLRSVTILSLWAFIVCFSQVYVGIHYPADVIAGGIVGSLVGAVTGFLTNHFFTRHLKTPAINF